MKRSSILLGVAVSILSMSAVAAPKKSTEKPAATAPAKKAPVKKAPKADTKKTPDNG